MLVKMIFDSSSWLVMLLQMTMRKTGAEKRASNGMFRYRSVLTLQKRYQDVGINCVIDFFGPPDEFKQWKTILGATNYQLLVLLPDEQVVVSRNASRDYPQKLKERKVRTNYKKFTRYDELSVRVLDTTSMSLSEVMEEIQLLNQ